MKILFADLPQRMYLASLISICVLLVLPQLNHADTGALEACRKNNKAVVTIGLPDRHRMLANSMRAPAERADAVIASNKVCAAFAYGNDYQILDWLETGKIDAAIVSPFVAEMFHERGEEHLSEYFGMATTWPFSGASLPSYRVETQVIGPNGVEPDSAEAYDGVIKTIRSSVDSMNTQIIVDSYLSVALPLLLDYTEHRLKELGLTNDDEDNEFWARFMQRLELRDGASNIANGTDAITVIVRPIPVNALSQAGESILVLSGEKPFQDIFVHSVLFHDYLFTGDKHETKMHWRAGTVPAWLRNATGQDLDVDEQLLEILDSSYTVREVGFRKHRHFRFKLDELWQVLAERRQSDDQFALILTGGGVKAAYQTSLIDHLYGKDFLSNARDPESSRSGATEKPIRVDHVIGTSGGALLGTFVMGIEGDADPDLTETLWRNEETGDHIGNFDVFPFFEMPRYLTLIVAGLLFSLVLFLFRRHPKLKQWTEPTTLPSKYQVKEEIPHAVPPSGLWIVLLIASPWIIKLVNGVKGLEHVPAITGLFYFTFVMLAIVSDNRLIFRPSFSWRNVHFRGITLVLLVGGILLAFVPFVAQLSTQFDIGIADLGELTLATLLCCLGILSIFLAIDRGFASSGDTAGEDTEKVDGSIITKAFVVLFLVPVIATLMVWLTGKSLFELSMEFWINFAIWSLVATVLLIAVGHWPKLTPEKNFFKVGLDFLVADFPRPTFMLQLKRYLRVTGFAALAFLYWNVVMAPAIYGNGIAKEYFERAYKKVICPNGMSASDCDKLLGQPLINPPKTNFVVSATSLEKKRERYFVFHPDIFTRGKLSAEGTAQSSESLKELLNRDPRWIAAGPDVTHQALLNIVFASGSPFPVFPATRAGLSEEQEEHEWLVDGGYAHNVPVEAANALGARRVLVISSSPLHQHDTIEDASPEKSEFEVVMRLGNLIQNVPRLFPYLFERSQIQDAVSAEKMLVATISPVLREKWPALTDFKSDVVEYLLSAAEEDKNARIGIVESWGQPVCNFQGTRYHCDELKAIESSQEAD